MTVEYEPAPRPAPLWALPLVIAALALSLLAANQRFTPDEVSGFGGHAQPSTPIPTRLADGTDLPEAPEALTRRFGENVVLTRRLDEVPDEVHDRCRDRYADETGPARARLHNLVESSAVAATHLGPDALTHLSIAVHRSPPGYPGEVAVACIARPGENGWEAPGAPMLDFALDGRPGAEMVDPDLSSRLVQVPVGARWAVQPQGGWWLAYDVRETSWTLMTLNDAISDRDALRVTFVDDTGEVVADRPVGPTRSAASGDHSADQELIAGAVREVLDRLDKGPMRTCDPNDKTLCVWLTFNERKEIVASAGFGPHPLDTPPMGYVGYCKKADLFQGSVTTAQFRTDGSWAGGDVNRGLDHYGVRFEAGKVVVDLSEHVVGDQAEGDPVDADADCVFTNKARGKPAE